jgi:hypothetical protein
MSETTQTPVALGDAIWELPPLILHPFSNDRGPNMLIEGSKAALMLAGLLPGEGEQQDELRRKLLVSRYAEIRMLFFVGKDLLRWVGQCMEVVSRTEKLASAGIREQSFAALLVYHTPQPVLQKLHQWGVANPQSVFSRAFGIATIFREIPLVECLSESFRSTTIFLRTIFCLQSAPDEVRRNHRKNSLDPYARRNTRGLKSNGASRPNPMVAI